MITPTQQRMLEILDDAQPHTLQELLPCLDAYSSLNAVSVQLCRLRRRLLFFGKTVQTIRVGNSYAYRVVPFTTDSMTLCPTI